MPAVPGKTSIGWIGTGVMGVHMALHAIKAGFLPMTVYNRTPSKAQPLVDAGAILVDTPQEVAQTCDIVFTMLGFPDDVREVISGPDGILSTLHEGAIIVDHTTSDPGLAAELAALAFAQGKAVLDAPVTGGDVGARNGVLSTLVGGHASALDHVRPILATYSSSITLFGPPGSGQHCKMANQITIATTMIGTCEGLLYAHAAGLDLRNYLAAISAGAASSFSVKNLAPRIVDGNLGPGFFVEHFVKDLSIALNACKQFNLSLPGLALAQQLYISLMACGDGRLGIHALIRVLERLNNKSLPSSKNNIAAP